MPRAFDRFHDIAMRLQRSEHVDESDMRDLFFAVMARCSVRRSTLPPTTCSPNAMARLDTDTCRTRQPSGRDVAKRVVAANFA